MNSKQTLGLAGSAILVVGTFCPFISVPLLGNLNYFQNGAGDGVVIIILAVVSAVLVLTEKYHALWITGALSAALLVVAFVQFHDRLGTVRQQLKSLESDQLSSGIGNAALDAVKLDWGFGLLVLGTLLLFASALVFRREIQTRVPGVPPLKSGLDS